MKNKISKVVLILFVTIIIELGLYCAFWFGNKMKPFAEWPEDANVGFAVTGYIFLFIAVMMCAFTVFNDTESEN